MKRLFAAIVAGMVIVLLPGPATADPAPPHAGRRLDRVSAALAEDPLFVDPDLASVLDPRQRASIRSAVGTTSRQLGTPVYIVVIPNPTDSESQGDNDAFLFALHDRMRRDGVYVMADSSAYLDAVAFRVPRDIPELPFEEAGPPNREQRFADLTGRLVRLLDQYRRAAPREPGTPTLYHTPAPFGQEDRLPEPRGAALKSPFLVGLLILGPLAAVALYWLALLAAVIGRRIRPAAARKPAAATGAHPSAPRRPTARWLRRAGARELDRLRDALSDTGTETGTDADAGPGAGRAYALGAYDAAQILLDDAGTDADRILDLVGVIVLARQGAAALAQATDAPRPPCFVNPLHGRSTGSRPLRLRGLGDRTRRRPVCEACSGLADERLASAILEVPGPRGPRPHFTVPGVWQATGFGAHRPNLVPHVLEYLGVD